MRILLTKPAFSERVFFQVSMITSTYFESHQMKKIVPFDKNFNINETKN